MIDQGELFVIPNPCRGICTVNNRGYCKGCLRSRKERFHWNEFSPFHQQLIINACEKRRLKIIAAKTEQPEEEFDEVIPQLDLFLAASNGTNELNEPAADKNDVAASSEEQNIAPINPSETATSNATTSSEIAAKPATKPKNKPTPSNDQFDLF